MWKGFVLAAMAALLGYLLWLPWVPELKHHNPTHTSLMRLRDAQARAKGRHLHSVLIWRPLSAISPSLIHAVLFSEDDTFYQHHGFNLEHIKFAVEQNWKRKRFAFGGSTITQQLARTLYLSPRKTLLRKAKEAVITVWIEHTLTKRRILELYLNVAEWGPGIYGAEAASRYYFHKPASDLTVDEGVSLAAILPSPRRWSPFSERAFMAQRRTNILEEMRRAGYIPEDSPTP